MGAVTDQTGAVVPSVTITIGNNQTGAVRTTITNDVGQYVASALPIGTYDEKAEASTFNVADFKGAVLNVNDRVRVDFRI